MSLADPPRRQAEEGTVLRLCCRNKQCAEYGSVRETPARQEKEETP